MCVCVQAYLCVIFGSKGQETCLFCNKICWLKVRGSFSSFCISRPSRHGCSLQASLGLRGLSLCGRIPDRTQTHTAVAQGPSLLPEWHSNSQELYLSATVSDYVCIICVLSVYFVWSWLLASRRQVSKGFFKLEMGGLANSPRRPVAFWARTQGISHISVTAEHGKTSQQQS